MDFERIKRALIIFMVFFNAYLLYVVVNRIPNFEGISSNTQVVLEDDFNSRGIKYPELSDEHESLPNIKVNRTSYLNDNMSNLNEQVATIDSNGVLSSTFDYPIDLGLSIDDDNQELSAGDKEELKNFINYSDLIIAGDRYTGCRYLANSHAIIFRMEPIEGHPIQDGTAELRLVLDENYAIAGYWQTFQGDFIELIEEKPLISQREALNVMNQREETYLPEGSTIKDIKLVYYRSHRFEQFDLYGPTWQINYMHADGTNKSVFIDAIKAKPIVRSQMGVGE